MLPKILSQDLSFDEYKKIWEEMDQIDPLTPINEKNEDEYFDIYRLAAQYDDYLFGDYDYCKDWIDRTTL